MLFPVLVFCALIFALLPMLLFLWNLTLYKPPPAPGKVEPVSVLIPARNEERSIEACVRAALASERVDLEVLVVDDHSEDRTADIVRQIARTDSRLQLFSAPPLPVGWCGKQFACSVLAQLASKPVLCFLDADVQLAPAGLARLITAMRGQRSSLISGFPRQITCSLLEQLLLPLMHFLLLGFLPLNRMRQSLKPSLGAGCGQIFVAESKAYQDAGGHAAIRSSRHDGITLPRAFRRAGFKTDLCDATTVACCRMYRNAHEVLGGLLKNATEGLASPKNIVPFSVLLFFGQILPLVLFCFAWSQVQSYALWLLSAAALAASLLPRLIAVVRFEQPLFAALLHPFAIFLLLGIQWLALVRAALRVPATWKGRDYFTA
jgi:hypothetical protein